MDYPNDIWHGPSKILEFVLCSLYTLCGTEVGDQRGVEWEPIKISFEIQTVGLYPENHPSPQAFWPKFGIAMEKLNQHKRSRTSERNHEANRKRIGKTADLFAWTGLTDALNRSGRSWLFKN